MKAMYNSCLGLMAVAGLMSWACSGTPDEPGSIPNIGGQAAGGEAGGIDPSGGATQSIPNIGGQAAGGEAGGIGHSGGATQTPQGGAGGMGKPACEPRSIEDTCGTCPEGPDDFDLKKNCGTDPYGGELGVDRYASDCGGVVVDVWGDKHDGASYYSSRYSFDARGTLIGYSFGTDVADECADVGSVCAPLGKPESLCPQAGAGGQGGAGVAEGG